jgi:hypothetical protein
MQFDLIFLRGYSTLYLIVCAAVVLILCRLDIVNVVLDTTRDRLRRTRNKILRPPDHSWRLAGMGTTTSQASS